MYIYIYINLIISLNFLLFLSKEKQNETLEFDLINSYKDKEYKSNNLIILKKKDDEIFQFLY